MTFETNKWMHDVAAESETDVFAGDVERQVNNA